MPVEMFVDGLEPADENAVIWRFMDLEKFQDLVATQELYFCRADRFDDQDEGLPPEDYIPVLGLNPLDLRDRLTMNHDLGSVAQFREGFFISCWYLFSEETAKMWERAKDGVAICSRYVLLKNALGSFDGRAFLGLVRYGSRHLTGWNVIRFITTKRLKYKHEKEVRAMLWIPDEQAGINRHFDENNIPHSLPLTSPPSHVPEFQRRRVDLQSLITRVVVSPFASTTPSEIDRFLRGNDLSIPVVASDLTRYKHLLPTGSTR